MECDKILVINNEIKDYLIKKNINASKIVTVYNGIDYVFENDRYDAVFVGRIHRKAFLI